MATLLLLTVLMFGATASVQADDLSRVRQQVAVQQIGMGSDTEKSEATQHDAFERQRRLVRHLILLTLLLLMITHRRFRIASMRRYR